MRPRDVSDVAPRATEVMGFAGVSHQRLLSFVRELLSDFRPVAVKRGSYIYHCGDPGNVAYFLEAGTVKTCVPTEAGKHCLLQIHGPPDFIGHPSLPNADRGETAIARTAVVIRKIPSAVLLEELLRKDLMKEFTSYLSGRLQEQQQIITSLVTSSAEARLAAALIRLGRNLGEPVAGELRLRERISCQELAEIVGTTRSRVGYFLARFRNLHLIHTDPPWPLRIRVAQLQSHMATCD